MPTEPIATPYDLKGDFLVNTSGEIATMTSKLEGALGALLKTYNAAILEVYKFELELYPVGTQIYLKSNIELKFNGAILEKGTVGVVQEHIYLDDCVVLKFVVMLETGILVFEELLHELDDTWGLSPPPTIADRLSDPVI